LTASLTVEPAPGNAPLPLPATVAFDQPGTEYRLTAALAYDEGGAADGAQRAGALDAFKLLPVALIGSGLIGVGVVLLLVLAARRRMGLD
jgi:hypothetical protein